MEFWLAYKFLLGSLKRTVFTLLSILVASIALILTISLGDSAKHIITTDLLALGSNRILLGGEALRSRDLEIVERFPFVEYGAFPEQKRLVKNILYKGYSSKALLFAKLQKLKENEIILDKSQFLNEKKGDFIELETTLGRNRFLIKDLYQEESPFETVKFGKRVIVSSETFEKLFGKNSYKKMIVAFPLGEDATEYFPLLLRELNRSRFSNNKINILETPEVYKKIEKIIKFVDKSIWILSIISLGIGGIGVLNLIQASIRERSQSIGILSSMGLSKNRIIKVFMIEVFMIILLGIILGSILGVLSAYIIGIVLKIPPYFNFFKIIMSLLITGSSSLLFGLYPAKKIVEIKIVEALTM